MVKIGIDSTESVRTHQFLVVQAAIGLPELCMAFGRNFTQANIIGHAIAFKCCFFFRLAGVLENGPIGIEASYGFSAAI